MHTISFEFCDFKNSEHVTALGILLNDYMADPMGDAPALSQQQQLDLADGLGKHPGAFVVFALCDGQFAGLTTCFELFSTFNVRKFINIHDVMVYSHFRGQGIGRKLMEYVIQLAKERQYCKITLEVREDNGTAQSLYRSVGFDECEPLMHFWTKKL